MDGSKGETCDKKEEGCKEKWDIWRQKGKGVKNTPKKCDIIFGQLESLIIFPSNVIIFLCRVISIT